MHHIIQKTTLIGSLFLTVLFASCEKQDPKAVALSFCQYQNSLEPEKAYALLSANDQKTITLKDFADQSSANGEAGIFIREKLQDRFTYQVLAVKDGKPIEVEVEVTAPDMSAIMQSMLSIEDAISFLGQSGGGDPIKKLLEKLEKHLNETTDIPTTKTTKTIRLIKEGGELKVLGDYAKK